MARSKQTDSPKPFGSRDTDRLYALANGAFVPAAPITNADLFAGRVNEIRKVANAITTPGQHAIIYGERGVGKTSLANILGPTLAAFGAPHFFSKVNCDRRSSFSALWKAALEEVAIPVTDQQIGFGANEVQRIWKLSAGITEKINPNDIRKLLTPLRPTVFIFDEFDRLRQREQVTFTDLIKTLSDYVTPTTVILVGVADTVDSLIRDHRSVDRALIQTQMPRMTDAELVQIIEKGADRIGVRFPDNVARQIVSLAEGLPHYVHLVSLHTVRAAADAQTLEVRVSHFKEGVRRAVDEASHSIKEEYHSATQSPRRKTLFKEVLLACALAKKDELSFFQAADVVRPLTEIMHRRYEIPSFASHLDKFSSEDRGRVLVKRGKKRGYRYRFKNPLLEPYIVMKGLSDGLIEKDLLQRLRRGNGLGSSS